MHTVHHQASMQGMRRAAEHAAPQGHIHSRHTSDKHRTEREALIWGTTTSPT